MKDPLIDNKREAPRKQRRAVPKFPFIAEKQADFLPMEFVTNTTFI